MQSSLTSTRPPRAHRPALGDQAAAEGPTNQFDRSAHPMGAAAFVLKAGTWSSFVVGPVPCWGAVARLVAGTLGGRRSELLDGGGEPARVGQCEAVAEAGQRGRSPASRAAERRFCW